MDVEKAKLVSIGEIKQTKKNKSLLNVVIQMPLGEKKTFVIFENSNSNFDLVKLFQSDYFKPGQTVAFNFNKASEDWQFDSIWALKIRDGERQDTATTGTRRNK